MIQPIEKGRFNMLNVIFQQQSLQFNWLSKTLRNMIKKGILFHSVSRQRWNFATYNLLKEFQCFTFEEVKLVWEYIPRESQSQILKIFPHEKMHIILEYLEGSDDCYNDVSPSVSLFSTLVQPHASTRHIYVFMRISGICISY